MIHRLLILVFFIFPLVSVAQNVPPAGSSFASHKVACDKALEKGDYEDAENICRKALEIAESLPKISRTERLGALQSYAFTLHSQSKFKEALTANTRAFKYALANFPNDKFVLGNVYFLLGRANQGMGSLDGNYIRSAIGNFTMAEKILAAGMKAASSQSERNKFKERLRDTLLLQRYIAVQRLDQPRFNSTQAKLDALDKTQ